MSCELNIHEFEKINFHLNSFLSMLRNYSLVGFLHADCIYDDDDDDDDVVNG